MIGPVGNHSFSGTVSLKPVSTGARDAVFQLSDQLAGSPNWLALIADIGALIAAIRTKDAPAILAAIEKLAADLGIALPPISAR